jgi:DNA-binding Lrp family transcriptional regulator
MDAWWDDIDDQILASLGANGSMTPVDLGRNLGLSERAVTSLLCLLAQEGKIHIRLVAAVDEARRDRSAA